VFGKDLFPVHDDVEDPAVVGDEVRVDAECVLEFRRQTGGLGFVVSLRAEVNIDLSHRYDLP